MMRRLFPHPALAGLLVLVWLLLANSLGVGTILMALLVGFLVPLFTAPYWRDKPLINLGMPLVGYIGLVMWDILIANFQVAWLILFRRNRDLNSCWLVIPLDIRRPEAITTLAGTISLTPGTVSADVSADGHALLVHALDASDPQAEVARIKSRYEARLKRIFR
ncbi:Na+/H+ antiporter subunit E [Croceicoccus marinus]|jgi:multicomponent K+:H+ antiporter subunit E|uniref:Na+/H+ antiporter subunit E n=1 Tax=Croceicoccus marinus TaxID=450378 RepID=A0A1Z1F9I4_9SPHN|nr:Na+/H+ antiporter subunit E [Croceicoccus marinus]ARU15451.1 Na+/H+ antiporter subunit E [Croceicoccus marinus]QNE04649.1 Na+/H+ antiporter subunit E [Croceicoccus marinus]